MSLDAVSLVRLALNIITERLLIIFILLLSFFLCCWTMLEPSWERIAISFFFSMFSYLAINQKVRNNIDTKPTD